VRASRSPSCSMVDNRGPSPRQNHASKLTADTKCGRTFGGLRFSAVRSAACVLTWSYVSGKPSGTERQRRDLYEGVLREDATGSRALVAGIDGDHYSPGCIV